MKTKEPCILAEPSKIDFSSVNQFMVHDSIVQLTNHFPLTLNIREVAKSCNCADVEIEPRTLVPGGTAKMAIRWKSGAKRGRVGESLTLLCNFGAETGPITVSQSVMIFADVVPEFEIQPLELSFSAIELSREVRLKPGKDTRPLKLLSAHTTA